MDSERLEKIVQSAPTLKNFANMAMKVIEDVDLKYRHARVALCLDISGTMHKQYVSGRMQSFTEKALALASLFDDNQKIDIFIFGDTAHYLGEMNVANFKDFLKNQKSDYKAVGGTHFDKAIHSVREHYFPAAEFANKKPISSKEPVYVLFVTDGSTVDEIRTVEQLVHASYEPIFWQFIALGSPKKKGLWGWLSAPFSEDFSFLEHMDEMEGRYVDNAGFFSVDLNSSTLALEDLYKLLMKEYPEWVEKAIDKKLINVW